MILCAVQNEGWRGGGGYWSQKLARRTSRTIGISILLWRTQDCPRVLLGSIACFSLSTSFLHCDLLRFISLLSKIALLIKS